MKAQGIDVNQGDGKSCPILVAALAGEGDVLTHLIDHGADLKCVGYNTKPLIAAAATLPKSFLEKIIGDSLKKPRVEINDSDFEGDTALIKAARANNAESVYFLLERGADILHTNCSNQDAMEVAIKHNSTDSIKVLAASASRIFRQLKHVRDTGRSDILDMLRKVDYSGLAVPISGDQTENNLEQRPVEGAWDEDETAIHIGEPVFEQVEAQSLRRIAGGQRERGPGRFLRPGLRRLSE